MHQPAPKRPPELPELTNRGLVVVIGFCVGPAFLFWAAENLFAAGIVGVALASTVVVVRFGRRSLAARRVADPQLPEHLPHDGVRNQ